MQKTHFGWMHSVEQLTRYPPFYLLCSSSPAPGIWLTHRPGVSLLQGHLQLRQGELSLLALVFPISPPHLAPLALSLKFIPFLSFTNSCTSTHFPLTHLSSHSNLFHSLYLPALFASFIFSRVGAGRGSVEPISQANPRMGSIMEKKHQYTFSTLSGPPSIQHLNNLLSLYSLYHKGDCVRNWVQLPLSSYILYPVIHVLF